MSAPLSPQQRRRLEQLAARMERLDQRIGELMEQRVACEEAMAAVYDAGRAPC